jgi:nucleotide sugar dehydrogenase
MTRSANPQSDAAARPTVCVQGLGFVGAAMAVATASARDARDQPCFEVVGLDLPSAAGQQRIDALRDGEFPFGTSDPRLIEATAAAKAAGNLDASSDPSVIASADVVVVDVHLDVQTEAEPPRADLEPFRAAIRTVGEFLRPGALVVVETTVPPGTCERVVAPELAAAFGRRGLPEDAFLLAHSYERVMPGENYLDSITNFWRVYAGHTPEAADACERFLEQIINVREFPLMRLAHTTATETAKVMENSYRATNIAFIEEWSRFATAVGIDLFEVIEAIRMRPTHSNMRQPGFGVGGYCLTKDPLFPIVAARQLFERPDLDFPFARLTTETNARMPLATVDRTEELLGGLEGRRLALLGVTYRQDVADTRYSPARVFVEEAQRRGASVVVSDPLVGWWPELEMPVEPHLPPAEAVDAVIFAVPHREVLGLDLEKWLGNADTAVIDANDVLTPAQRAAVKKIGCPFAKIGRGDIEEDEGKVQQ